MTSFINNLDRLNLIERYYLIGMALGNPKFKLNSAFHQNRYPPSTLVVAFMWNNLKFVEA